MKSINAGQYTMANKTIHSSINTTVKNTTKKVAQIRLNIWCHISQIILGSNYLGCGYLSYERFPYHLWKKNKSWKKQLRVLCAEKRAIIRIFKKNIVIIVPEMKNNWLKKRKQTVVLHNINRVNAQKGNSEHELNLISWGVTQPEIYQWLIVVTSKLMFCFIQNSLYLFSRFVFFKCTNTNIATDKERGLVCFYLCPLPGMWYLFHSLLKP